MVLKGRRSVGRDHTVVEVLRSCMEPIAGRPLLPSTTLILCSGDMPKPWTQRHLARSRGDKGLLQGITTRDRKGRTTTRGYYKGLLQGITTRDYYKGSLQGITTRDRKGRTTTMGYYKE